MAVLKVLPQVPFVLGFRTRTVSRLLVATLLLEAVSVWHSVENKALQGSARMAPQRQSMP